MTRAIQDIPSSVSDYVDIAMRRQKNFSITKSAAVFPTPGTIEGGRYDFWSPVDCYIRIDETDASAVNADEDYLLRGNVTVTFRIPRGYAVGCIVDADATMPQGGAKLRFQKIG